MESVKIKKSSLKDLLKEFYQIQEKYSEVFQERSFLDYCEVKIKNSGFSISFSKRLPANILDEISRIFANYSVG